MPKGHYIRHSGNSGKAVRRKKTNKKSTKTILRKQRQSSRRARRALKEQFLILEQEAKDPTTRLNLKTYNSTDSISSAIYSHLLAESHQYNTHGLQKEAIEAAAILCTLVYDKSLFEM